MEILVHVSAPSTAQHDARYRAQVDAIQACQPTQQWQTLELPAETTEPEPEPETQTSRSSPKPRGLHSPARSDHPHLASPCSVQALQPIATTIGASPPAPLDRVHHPVQEHASCQGQDSLDSLDSLISVIPDSQPDAETSVHPIPTADPGPSHTRENSPAKRCRREPLRRTATSTCTSGPSATNANSPLPAILPSTANPVASVTRENQDNQDIPQNLGRIPLLQHPSHLLPFLPLEIHPALPPISTDAFTSHITPTLSMLTERLKPARTYNPRQQIRTLHPLERGYWAAHITLGPGQDQNQNPQLHWDLTTFHRFWSFLSDFIGKDSRAGWGVWCILEPTDTSPPSTSSTESVQVLLKVYTWGEIALHIYLLLFLASERRIRKMELQWRDAREEIVVQMP